MEKFSSRFKCGVSLLTAAILPLTSQPLQAAQDTVQNSIEDEIVLEEIMVTGSRIKRRSLDSPTPVAVIGAEDLAFSGKLNLGDYLSELPQLGSTFTTANSTRFIGTAGGSFLDLRRLGSVRTLVLVDGRRHVGSSAGDTRVDINTIPSDLIERVEVITGGASAIYGSDAVTGVVNFILKENYEGLTARAQYGLADEGPYDSYHLSLTGGGNFNDDRGNAVLSVEWAEESRVKNTDREFSSRRYRLVNNPDDTGPDDGIPDQFYRPNSGISFITKAGTIFFDLGSLMTFDPDGSVRDQVLGTDFGGFECMDCDFLDLDEVSDLRPSLQRLSLNGKFTYDLTEDISVFAEAKYVNTQTFNLGQPAFDFFGSAITIQRDNAFLKSDLAALMDDAGVTEIGINRFNVDAGRRGEDNERQTHRIVAGFKGDLGEAWTWEASYSFGRSTQILTAINNRINDRWTAATDAVVDPATGEIVCRVTLEDSDNSLLDGCIPTSIFGDGAVNAASEAWFNQDTIRRDTIEQQVASAFISGSVYELPAGDLDVAVGIEWRKDTSLSKPAPLDSAGLTFGNALQVTSGEIEVKEAFGEISVPVLKDAPFAESLMLDAAIRYADYDTSSDKNTTWKVGGTWQPISDVRFRATYSKAVRAPNIGELFGPQDANFFSVDDPCKTSELDLIADPARRSNREANCAALGVAPDFDSDYDQATLPGLSGGNPDLEVETAKTWTAGVVVTPRFLDGFSATVDWWQVTIDDAISSTDAQDILDRCVDAESINNIFCPLITRDSTDEITNILQIQANIAGLEASGVDFDITYNISGIANTDGMLSLKLMGTYLLYNRDFPFQDEPDNPDREDGELGDPEWLMNFTATYYSGPWTFNYKLRFIDDMLRVEHEDFEASPEEQELIHTGTVTYSDIQLRYQIRDGIEVYGGVNNIFEKNPPLPFDATGGDSGIYDNVGRFFYTGVTATF
ncbi:TonB-dependent receptor domain-containing protein [Paremcibacter congregatus]|uniref:TonB-dependent receptor n=1 Tax=Paremcibacter congregatus TaxID=2043170 RepID=A0A2G4YTJ8_9PROT|nr:TonB-dependent receptor [Paremcibacter congregatus]PHZ85570.1 TonB-dependent receptor [Paremcibacter congregatus]QDE26530.1 TonB-dependent receptor [Paremcibacter congregatus]